MCFLWRWWVSSFGIKITFYPPDYNTKRHIWYTSLCPWGNMLRCTFWLHTRSHIFVSFKQKGKVVVSKCWCSESENSEQNKRRGTLSCETCASDEHPSKPGSPNLIHCKHMKTNELFWWGSAWVCNTNPKTWTFGTFLWLLILHKLSICVHKLTVQGWLGHAVVQRVRSEMGLAHIPHVFQFPRQNEPSPSSKPQPQNWPVKKNCKSSSRNLGMCAIVM